MIAVVLAVCATIIILGTIKVWCDRPRLPPDPELDAINEKRRVIERQRADWAFSISSDPDVKARARHTTYVLDLDKQLLKLSEELAELGRKRAQPK